MLARLRLRALDLISPEIVLPPDQFRLDPGWLRHHSWLCFAPADPLVGERGSPGVAYRRWVSVDGGTTGRSWDLRIRSIADERSTQRRCNLHCPVRIHNLSHPRGFHLLIYS